MNMYYCKINEMNRKKVIGVCDDYLLNETLFNGFKITEKFYGDKKSTEDEVLGLIKSCTAGLDSFNFMGENSVNIAKKLEEDAYIIILKTKDGKSVPHTILII